MWSSRAYFALLACAGCGRWGFEDQATPDGAATPDVPVDGHLDSIATLPCGQPTRFTIGAGPVTAVAAAATPSGFAVLTVGATALAGWSLDWQGTALEATARGIQLDVDTRDIVGAAAIGADVVAAAVYGVPTGTKLYPLGGGMALRAPAVPRGEIAGDRPIARAGKTDALALVTIDEATSQIDARPITTLGESAGPAGLVAPAAELASSVSIGPAGPGYLVSWTSRAGTPNVHRVALLDPALGVVAGPVSTSATAFDAIRGRAVWASGPDRYLVAWFEKNAVNGDDVWFQIRGPNLEAITTAQMLVANAYSPVIESDGTAFWVAYIDATAAPAVRLAAAHVSASGQITPRPVPHDGGSARTWTMVTRARQSILVWTEVGGAGPDLYLDPMCN